MTKLTVSGGLLLHLRASEGSKVVAVLGRDGESLIAYLKMDFLGSLAEAGLAWCRLTAALCRMR